MNQRVHMSTKSILLSNWISLIRMEKQEWHGCHKCGVVYANIKCLGCQTLKPWNTLNYWVRERVTQMQSPFLVMLQRYASLFWLLGTCQDKHNQNDSINL